MYETIKVIDERIAVETIHVIYSSVPKKSKYKSLQRSSKAPSRNKKKYPCNRP
jgi:hypothetical protein